MTVSTYKQPNFNNDNATEYKTNIDGAFAVLRQIAQSGAPHATDPNSKKIKVDAIEHFDGGTIISQSEQTSAEFSFPSSEDRIDRVVFDESDLSISIVQGTEASSPSAPAIPSGKIPCCQVRLSPSDSTISNDMITDERKSFLFYGINAVSTVDAQNVTQTYKGNDIDSDGDGVVDKADDSEAFDGLEPEDGNDGEVLKTDGTENGLSWGIGSNKQVFTSDGTFDVPSNVSEVVVTVVAGGGGGGEGNDDNSGGGGGSGGVIVNRRVSVTGGNSISVTVGSGGAGGDGAGADAGDDGGDSSFGSVTAKGGTGGIANGGSGGGGGRPRTTTESGGDGGSNQDSGRGGDSLMGLGGDSVSNNNAGKDGNGFSSGGSGGGGGKIGGDGADGIVIVQW